MVTEVTSQDGDQSPYPGTRLTEIISGTVDTDASGNGTLSVTFDSHFGSAPAALVDATSDPATTVQNVTEDGADIVVSGSATTSGTVTAAAVFIGPRR